MNKKEWMDLKPNDLIISKSGMIRKVITNNKGSIRLLKLRKSWTRGNTTVYTKNDRLLFSVYAKWLGNRILQKTISKGF